MFAANLETLLWEHTNGKWWVLAALVTWACAYLWLLSIDAELFSMVVALLLAVIPPFALLALLSLAVTTLFAEPRGWDWAWFAGSLAGVVVLFILMKMEKLPGKTLLERDQDLTSAFKDRVAAAFALAFFLVIGAAAIYAGHQLAFGSGIYREGSRVGAIVLAALAGLRFTWKSAPWNPVARANRALKQVSRKPAPEV